MRNLNYWQALWLSLCLLALSGAACQQINPVGAADTVEQKAFALYGTYVIFAEKAADLAERPEVSNSVKLRLIQAEERASPVVDSMLEAVAEVEEIRAELNASDDRLATALVSLNDWVTRVGPLIDELIREVRGAS